MGYSWIAYSNWKVYLRGKLSLRWLSWKKYIASLCAKFLWCFCIEQVPFLLFLYPQCCSKGKIHCICINRGRDWSSWIWIETWNWPPRSCWWDILRYLWQIWTSQWTFFGQLLYFDSECNFFFLNAAASYDCVASPFLYGCTLIRVS